MLRAIGLSLFLTACTTAAYGQDNQAQPKGAMPDTTPAIATIINKAGADIGQVAFTPAPTGVLIRISLKPGSLTPGWHGTHLHAVGDCSDTATFETAQSHIENQVTDHGLLYPQGPETGDLPNLSVGNDGSAAAEFFTDRTTLTRLRDSDGTALIIHANRDDQFTQPGGGSGDRVACAALRM